jgi:acyl carrier protein
VPEMSFDEFTKYVQTELEIDFPTCDPSADLAADLTLDSLSRFEFLLLLAELGAAFDESTMLNIRTLADAYSALE